MLAKLKFKVRHSALLIAMTLISGQAFAELMNVTQVITTSNNHGGGSYTYDTFVAFTGTSGNLFCYIRQSGQADRLLLAMATGQKVTPSCAYNQWADENTLTVIY